MTDATADTTSSQTSPSECHPEFELVQSSSVDSIGVRIDDYRHKHTGARHIHLASASKENVFVVAFPTLPVNSAGVAHILEHTVLCGSEKYPVRDPFFMMMRRSLSTFMNAFTSSDWTAFPFATQNTKDFDNLLGVYLDAAFFSRLDPLDFAQEGHRLEFAQGDDPTTPLEIKGVVYNEMKGAMSSPVTQLYQRLKRQLFATTTYHFNSGGDPSVIPSLTYEQLIQFYKTHYHPSNSLFCTFGNIPALKHQTRFQDLCLHRFEQGQKHKATLEMKQFAPTFAQESYPFHGEDTHKQSHFVVGWVLPEPKSPADELAVDLLSTLLGSNGATPIRQMLESSPFGTPSPLTGLLGIGRQSVYCVGFQGCNPEDQKAMQQLILDTLAKVVETGFDQDEIDAGIFQLEIYQKQITGQSQPYGLELALDVISAGLYDKPVQPAIDIGPAIEELKTRLQDQTYLQDLVQDLLIDNQHRTSLLLTPDASLSQKMQDHEKQSMAERKASLSSEQTKTLVEKAKALSERQETLDDASVLPKLELSDIPEKTEFVKPSPLSQESFQKGQKLTVFERKTNGLIYFQTSFCMPELTDMEVKHLSALYKVWTEVGAGKKNYLQIQKEHFACTGHISASMNIRTGAQDPAQLSAYSIMRAFTLNRNFDAMIEHCKMQTLEARFDERARIKELLEQQKHQAVQSLAGRGHLLALNAANSPYHAYSSFQHDMAGLGLIQHLSHKQFDDKTMDSIAQTLETLRGKIISQPREVCLIGDEHLEGWSQSLSTPWTEVDQSSSLLHYPVRADNHQVWLGSTQINFCAMSLPTVDRLHPDAPALTVLGVIMTNEFLHTALREKGGAYGGAATANSKTKTFEFHTYRDPRITETFDDFFRAMDWAKSEKFTQKQKEEAVLSLISGMDKPGSPSGEAVDEFNARLHGRTQEERQAFRRAILHVSLDDLSRVANRYFDQDSFTKVVVTNKATYESEQLKDFTVHEI